MRRTRGSSAVETSFAILFLLAFLMMTADVTRILYRWSSLQYAVNQAGRFGILGQTDPGDPNREISIINRVVSVANSLGVNIGAGDVSLEDSGGGATAGGASSFFTVRAQSLVSVTPVSSLILKILGTDYNSRSITIQVASVARNEPFAS